MHHSLTGILAATGVACAAPAAAEVVASSDVGFVSHHEAIVAAGLAEVWAAMLKPAGWWNGAHTYSGNAANLTIAPTVGGCFCEVIPDSRGGPSGQIEHMRVIYVAPNSTLRMSGGLGPLQSEAVTAVLTMALERSGEGTKISWDFVVGGYSRTPIAMLAPLVDQVIGEQFTRLAASVSKP